MGDSWLIIVAGALPWDWGTDGDPWPAFADELVHHGRAPRRARVTRRGVALTPTG